MDFLASKHVRSDMSNNQRKVNRPAGHRHYWPHWGCKWKNLQQTGKFIQLLSHRAQYKRTGTKPSQSSFSICNVFWLSFSRRVIQKTLLLINFIFKPFYESFLKKWMKTNLMSKRASEKDSRHSPPPCHNPVNSKYALNKKSSSHWPDWLQQSFWFDGFPEGIEALNENGLELLHIKVQEHKNNYIEVPFPTSDPTKIHRPFHFRRDVRQTQAFQNSFQSAFKRSSAHSTGTIKEWKLTATPSTTLAFLMT